MSSSVNASDKKLLKAPSDIESKMMFSSINVNAIKQCVDSIKTAFDKNPEMGGELVFATFPEVGPMQFEKVIGIFGDLAQSEPQDLIEKVRNSMRMLRDIHETNNDACKYTKVMLSKDIVKAHNNSQKQAQQR